MRRLGLFQFSGLRNNILTRAGSGESRNVWASEFCTLIENELENENFGRVILRDLTKNVIMAFFEKVFFW